MNPCLKTLLPATILLGMSANADAALANYLEITGIKGDSSVKGHEGQIDVVSWGWGLSKGAQIGPGQVLASPGDPKLQNLSIVKNLDGASAPLQAQVFLSSVLPTVTLQTIDDNCGGDAHPLSTVVLTNAVATSSSMGFGADLNGAPQESVTFAFEKICILSEIQDDNGACLSFDTKGFSYDFVKDIADSPVSCP